MNEIITEFKIAQIEHSTNIIYKDNPYAYTPHNTQANKWRINVYKCKSSVQPIFRDFHTCGKFATNEHKVATKPSIDTHCIYEFKHFLYTKILMNI